MTRGQHLAAQALAARLADRERRRFVYENPPPESGFFLLLCDDDDGGLILVKEVVDFERAKRQVRP